MSGHPRGRGGFTEFDPKQTSETRDPAMGADAPQRPCRRKCAVESWVDKLVMIWING